jgi:hypothetical protein
MKSLQQLILKDQDMKKVEIDRICSKIGLFANNTLLYFKNKKDYLKI